MLCCKSIAKFMKLILPHTLLICWDFGWTQGRIIIQMQKKIHRVYKEIVEVLYWDMRLVLVKVLNK